MAEWYQSWHNKNKQAGQASSSNRQAPLAKTAEPEGSSSSDGVMAELSDDQRRQAAALLAAIDASLLSPRFDVLGRHAGFPFHFATLVPGTGSLPAAEWMHAMLKYGQYQHKLAQLTEEAKLLKAYSSYTVFSHTLLYTLFRTWVQQTTSEAKPYLALPTKAEAELFMQKVAEKTKPDGVAPHVPGAASSRGARFTR